MAVKRPARVAERRVVKAAMAQWEMGRMLPTDFRDAGGPDKFAQLAERADKACAALAKARARRGWRGRK